MTSQVDILIVGASARAAAYSAWRAGLKPWAADLFADADLGRCFPCVQIAENSYPNHLLTVLQHAPLAPWLYTGALENRPVLVGKLARLRALWGNGQDVLQRVRDPFAVEALLRGHGLPCPRHERAAASPPSGERWLVKPLAGAGGRGVRWPAAREPLAAGKVYWQEFIEGEPCAAVYVGATLLGVTRQLIGQDWLNVGGFHYCGSIGPLSLSDSAHTAFERLGQTVADGFGLRGVYGVDCVLRDGVPYPVEINPRYTASVEVLEHATGVQALALHAAAFGALLPGTPRRQQPTGVVGKAILFARQSLVFPDSGPWPDASAHAPDDMPALADIPHAGTPIEIHQPILTLLARADSMANCVEELRRRALDLDRWLARR